jgi:hypothetical protein
MDQEKLVDILHELVEKQIVHFREIVENPGTYTGQQVSKDSAEDIAIAALAILKLEKRSHEK